MNTETTLIASEEEFVLEKIEDVGRRLDELRELVRDAVRHGGQLGSVLTELTKQKREKLWVWLKAMKDDVREDVIRFALKAHQTVMKPDGLESTAQLTFALADAPAFTGHDASRPARHESDPFSEVVRSFMRARIALHDFTEEFPPERWDAQTRAQLQGMVKPLVSWEADEPGQQQKAELHQAVAMVEAALVPVAQAQVLAAWEFVKGRIF